MVSGEMRPYLFMGDLNIPFSGGKEFISRLDRKFNNSLEFLGQMKKEEILNSGTHINGAVIDYIFTDKTNYTI